MTIAKFFSVVSVSKKQPKQIGKVPEMSKIQLWSDDDNSLKNFSKMHKFWNLKFWSRSFKVSVSNVSLDYITDYVTKQK